MESPCEYDSGPLESTSYGVSYIDEDPLVIPRLRMDLKEIDINTRNWVNSTQGRDYWRALVSATLELWNPQVMELVT